MKGATVTALVLAVLMIGAFFSAEAMKPTEKLADTRPPVTLVAMIPEQFGDWKTDDSIGTTIVNPQQQETIDRIYAQTLSRIYINSAGERVMLTIAYGKDQRDSLQVHTPDVCYPAQGFKIESGRDALLETGFGSIPVRQRIAKLGARIEPLTYWTTVGNEVVRGGLHKRTVELRYGFLRQIPDGLLFRVSSIDHDSARAFLQQQQFVDSLLGAVSGGVRLQLAGLGAQA